MTARVDLRDWDDRAESLGGTTNSLLVGFTSRLAHNVGWVAQDGSANLTVPVNDRVPGDTRGNALSGVALTIDPEGVTTDLGEVRTRIRQALAKLRADPTALVGPLPLTPLIPKSATRRMQDRVLKSAVITCSNLGDLDPTVNRPDGTDADRITVRSIRMAQQVTRADLQRSGGIFFPVALGRIHGEVFLTVGYASADGSTTRSKLATLVLDTLAQFGLSGRTD